MSRARDLRRQENASAFVAEGLGDTALMAQRANTQRTIDVAPAALPNEPEIVAIDPDPSDNTSSGLEDIPRAKSINIGEKVLGDLATTPRRSVVESKPLVFAQQESVVVPHSVKDDDSVKVPHRAETKSEQAAVAPGTPVVTPSKPEVEPSVEPPAAPSAGVEPVAIDVSKSEMSVRDRFAQFAVLERKPPPTGRYTVHLTEEMYAAYTVARGDVPITAWFIALVARYHDEVFKALPSTTPLPQLGLIQKRVYRKKTGPSYPFFLWFSTKTEVGRAQQALFEECKKSASTTTEYVVAILQAHLDDLSRSDNNSAEPEALQD